MDLKAFLLSLLFCTPLFGAEAVVTGPDEVSPGDLISLSHEGSTGDHFRWIPDSKLEGKTATCTSHLMAATGTPGTYQFILVASDANGIDFKKKTVVVNGKGSPPQDPPSSDYEALLSAHRTGLTKLADDATAKRLKSYIGQSEGNSLESLRLDLSGKIEKALLERTGESRFKPWTSVWRQPVDSEIQKLNPQSMKELKAIISILIQSFPTAEQASTQKPVVIMYTKDNCGFCDSWNAIERPKLSDWHVITLKGSAKYSKFPTFEIIKDYQVLSGYQPSEAIRGQTN